jgi:hypothetical protein
MKGCFSKTAFYFILNGRDSQVDKRCGKRREGKSYGGITRTDIFSLSPLTLYEHTHTIYSTTDISKRIHEMHCFKIFSKDRKNAHHLFDI